MPIPSVAAGVLLLPHPHTSTSLGRAYDASCCWRPCRTTTCVCPLRPDATSAKVCHTTKSRHLDTCSQLTRLRHLSMRPCAPLGPAHLSNAERRPRQVEVATQPPEEVQEHSIARRRQHQGPLRPECTCRKRAADRRAARLLMLQACLGCSTRQLLPPALWLLPVSSLHAGGCCCMCCCCMRGPLTTAGKGPVAVVPRQDADQQQQQDPHCYVPVP